MDEDWKQTLNLILIAVVLIILVFSAYKQTAKEAGEASVLGFIMDNCLDEHAINTTMTTGNMSLISQDGTCVIRWSAR